MTDTIIAGILLLLCLGQALSFLLGRVAAVAYFMCASQLAYFSVWFYATWDPFRLCGLILLLGFLLLDRREKVLNRLRKHRFIWLIVYGICATLAGSFFWPTSYVALSSPVYTSLRSLIQIANWCITLGCGWIIGNTLALGPRSFRRMEHILVVFAVCLSLYALYQYAAYQTGLPHTGTRYTASEFGVESSVESLPAYALAGRVYYRVNALHGEPKHFAAFCVFIAALLFSQLLFEGFRWSRAGALLLCLTALWLTASTAGLIGLAACIGVIALAAVTWQGRLPRRISGLAAAAAGVLTLAAAISQLPGAAEYVRDDLPAIMQARVFERMEEADQGFAGSWATMPEQVTFDILKARPRLALFGTGLGGMSYYIAEYIGGSPFILFPNAGLLGLLANLGAAFLLLLFWVFHRPLQLLTQRRGAAEVIPLRLLVMGSVVWIQVFIFAGTALLAYGCGFLLAAELWRRPKPAAAGNHYRSLPGFHSASAVQMTALPAAAPPEGRVQKPRPSLRRRG